MNINELDKLAKAATPGPWSNRVVEGMEDNILSCNEDKWIVFSDESATVEQNDSDYIAAANPSAILELIAAYREAVAALNEALPGCIGYAEYWSGKGADKADKSCMQVREALDTAKRLGVE